MKNYISTSVIIPTYTDWPRLKLCLDALNLQTYPTDKFEVIIVNNGPEDSCPYELPSENMKIITETKPSAYAARNAGVRTAKGEIIAFTDSDCIPQSDWLAEAMRLKDNPNMDIMAGNVKLMANHYNIYYKYETLFGFQIKKYVLKSNFGVTANLVVKKNVFETIGFFNDKLKSGGDYEFCNRAVKNGFNISYNSGLVVKHPSRESFYELKKKAKRFGGNLPDGSNKIVLAFKVISRLRLPVLDFIYVFRQQNYSLKEKIDICLIRLKIKYISGFESIRIYMGKNSNRS